MHNTTTYIDVLQKIVENYNLAYHSGIKKAPIDVKVDDKDLKNTLPKWSVIHKIIDKNVHSYKLDNGKFYKYYELQKVDDVQKLNEPIKGPTREQMSKERNIKRKFANS